MSALFPYEPAALDRGGFALRYVDEGSGPPMLMVHGNPTWSFYFRSLIAAFRGTHRVIAPDHIGCGRSDKPSEDRYRYTLASRIDDLTALCESLDLRDVTLVVHDWGGAIGMGWAVQAPERVRRIVVLNTAAFSLPPGRRFPPSLWLARVPGLGSALVRGANAFVRGANRLCTTRRPLAPEVARAYLEPYPTWRSRLAVHRFVQDIPLSPDDEAAEALAAVERGLPHLADKPMLVCWGMRDFIFDAAFLEGWEARFPRAEVHRFDDCGHYVLEDAADEIVPLLRTFVARDEEEAARP